MSAGPARLLTAAIAAIAALAAGASSTAAAAGFDPAIYDPGVAAGQVEHGVVAFRLSGSPTPEHRRIEYWITAGRWREQTTDAATGALIAGRVHDARGTTWLQYKPINGDPRILHFKGDDSVPGAGYPAPYNRKLVETGLLQGSAEIPLMVTLQPIGTRTIAGFSGTTYEQLTNGRPGLARVGAEPERDSHAILVLQTGTFQPLLREFSAPNGSFGTIVQREVLLSRETTPVGRARVQLTEAGFARTVAQWRAKVRAAKAIKKKRKQ
jgi:hypothetical protein